jgi:hypothetical protein
MFKRGKSNKFKAKKVKIDGYVFDSQKEYTYYLILKARLQAGEITKLEIKPIYELRGYGGKIVCKMIPDFRYMEKGKQIIDEVKSKITITPVYRLKKKLLLDNYPKINFREILKV